MESAHCTVIHKNAWHWVTDGGTIWLENLVW